MKKKKRILNNFILNRTCTIAIAKTTFVSCLMPNIFHVNNMQHAYNQICEKINLHFFIAKMRPLRFIAQLQAR